jgi:hypothetical protein
MTAKNPTVSECQATFKDLCQFPKCDCDRDDDTGDIGCGQKIIEPWRSPPTEDS